MTRLHVHYDVVHEERGVQLGLIDTGSMVAILGRSDR